MNIAIKVVLPVIVAIVIGGAYAQESQLPIPSPGGSVTNPRSGQDADAVSGWSRTRR